MYFYTDAPCNVLYIRTVCMYVCVCVCVCVFIYICKGFCQHRDQVHVSVLSRVWLFCDPMDCSPPVSSVHGILQARILEWVAISFSRGSSQTRDSTHSSCRISCIGRWILYHWTTREACSYDQGTTSNISYFFLWTPEIGPRQAYNVVALVETGIHESTRFKEHW